MFRITLHSHEQPVRITVEGRLHAAAATELERLWRPLAAAGGRPAVIDLTGVTFVDAVGRSVLRQLGQRGARFLTRDCQVRACLSEVSMDAPLPAEGGNA